MTDVNWHDYGPLLDAKDLAVIYKRRVGGVRKALQERSPKLPTPCQVRPFKVRKSDCQRHFSRMSA